MKLNIATKNIAKCVMASTIFFLCSNILASEYKPPVKNLYINEFHWSLPPDLRSLMALSSASREKYLACADQSNSAGTAAAGVYDKHIRNGDSMDLLAKNLSTLNMIENYKPTPKRALEHWNKDDSHEDVSKLLDRRTLDLAWGYYKDYEKPAATTDKTSVAQQVMWDYCLTIPKELFVE